jgi:hypothetical protein
VPRQWAITHYNLGNALTILGERQSSTTHLEKAVAAYRAALEVFEAGQTSHNEKQTKENLRRTDALLRERQAPGGAAKEQ